MIFRYSSADHARAVLLDRKGSEVVIVLATDTIKIAADKMREHGVAALVIMSGDAIKGLIARSGR
jgi:CBS domain-containing protein